MKDILSQLYSKLHQTPRNVLTTYIDAHVMYNLVREKGISSQTIADEIAKLGKKFGYEPSRQAVWERYSKFSVWKDEEN